MADREGLLALAERVEQASAGPDYALDEALMRAVGWKARPMNWRMEIEWEGPDGRLRQLPRPTYLLDDAVSLVPEGWSWTVSRNLGLGDPAEATVFHADHPFEGDYIWRAAAATPALALTAAALRARAQMEEDHV